MTRLIGPLAGNASGIVKSNLLMNLDPGNPSSYSGTGTTVTDLSGTGHNGTISGSLGYSASNGGVWNFTNNGAYILAGTLPYSGSSVNSWSMGIWVQPLTANGNIISMSVTNPSGSWNMPPIRASNQTFIGKVWNNNYLTSQVFNIGVWYYVVLTFDYTAGTQNLYVDGNLVASQSGIASASSGSDNYWFIGQTNPGADNSGNLVGNIGAIHYYGNKALTGSEVVRNYNALQKRYKTTGYVTNGLVMYWDFGNSSSYPGTGTTVTDLSGNGNNGTINGSGGSYSSTFGGVYTFGGNGNTITGGPNLSSGNFTVMGSARYLNGQNLRIISALNNNWLLGHWNGSNMNYYSNGWVSQVNQGSTDNAWRIYTGTGNPTAGVYAMYSNTSLITYNSAGTAGPNQFAINSYANASEYSNGQFGFLLAYNRVLTAAEIAQNYEYFKGRYSLVKQSYDCVNQYTGSQTWVNPGIAQADVFVTAGGAGGGNVTYGGGGAGGGVIYNTNYPLASTSTATITIGGGGGATASGSNTIFGSLTAIGGGYGGNSSTGANGGSGGGAKGQTSSAGGTATTGQGNTGGAGAGSTSGGGGGGGYVSAGSNGNGNQGNNFAGAGGFGKYYYGTMYGAGGGGGGYTSGFSDIAVGGAGGSQGTGEGCIGSGASSATSGNANTGNGGGGGSAAGSGGSGVVLVRYVS
jgi:hypothetical protein